MVEGRSFAAEEDADNANLNDRSRRCWRWWWLEVDCCCFWYCESCGAWEMMPKNACRWSDCCRNGRMDGWKDETPIQWSSSRTEIKTVKKKEIHGAAVTAPIRSFMVVDGSPQLSIDTLVDHHNQFRKRFIQFCCDEDIGWRCLSHELAVMFWMNLCIGTCLWRVCQNTFEELGTETAASTWLPFYGSISPWTVPPFTYHSTFFTMKRQETAKARDNNNKNNNNKY